MKKLFFATVFAAATLLMGPVDAALMNVVNTGAAGSNAASAGLGKWTLASNPGGFSSTPVTVTTPAEPWANPAGSSWISVAQNQLIFNNPNPLFPSGLYSYVTQFSYAAEAGFNIGLTGRVFSDNSVKVFLNNVQIGLSGGVDLDGDGLPDNYTNPPLLLNLSDGNFVAGTNTLRFDVTNGPQNGLTQNPTGLNVGFDVTRTQIPEPASIAVWGAAGFAALMFRRRKSKS